MLKATILLLSYDACMIVAIPVNGNTDLTATEVGKYHCPPWFFYNSIVQECQTNIFDEVTL